MKRKALLSVPLAILAILAVGAFAAPSVQAHDGTASGTCNGGVQWDYHNYDKTVTNSITVTIDGTVRYQDLDFKASDSGQILTDKTVAHSWKVDVDGPLYFADGQWHNPDRHPNGSYAACVVPPTTTVAPTTTQVPSSTTVVVTTTAPAATTVPDATTTVVTTTSVVAVDLPPVPCPYNPSVPTGSPLCVPPVAEDVVALTPAEPRLPITGAGDTVALIVLALIMIGTGWYLARKGRRVS